MSLLETITWNIARAGGFTAFVLLTCAVAMGVALSSHWQSSSRWPRIINNEIHNFLTLLALIFAGIHILALWLDPFTSFSWSEMFIPFMSSYRPIWTAFGIISLYLGLAIGLSTWLRPVIGYKWWRSLHVFTLLLYLTVAVHGIAAGSDSRTWWGTAIYLISIFLIGTLLVMRLLQPINKVITRPADASEVVGTPGIGVVAMGSTVVSTQRRRAHPVLALVTILVVLGGTVWAVLGPLQAGWAATKSSQSVASTSIAANSAGNSAPASPFSPGAVATPQITTPQTTFPQSFTGNLAGQITQSQSRRSGIVTIQLDMNISNGPTGDVEVALQGTTSGTGDTVSISNSEVALLSSDGQPVYEGTVSQLDTTNQWSITAQLTGTDASTLDVQMKLTVDSNNGTVTGTITAGSGSSSGGSSSGGSSSGGSSSGSSNSI
jgi:hypothetical protein